MAVMRRTARLGPVLLGAGLIAALSFLPAGCYDTSLSGNADSSSDEADVDVDLPAADTGADSWWDTGTDTGTDPVVEPVPDTAVEVPWEVAPETPTTTCSMVDQTGCEAGWWCSFAVDEFSCTLAETCFETGAGTIAPGQVCESAGTVRCQPGSECYWNEPDPADLSIDPTCHQWCRSDADCTVEGSWCGFSLGGHSSLFGPCAGLVLEFPYRLCKHPE